MHARNDSTTHPRGRAPMTGLLAAAALVVCITGCSALRSGGGSSYRPSAYKSPASSSYDDTERLVYDFFFQLGRAIGEALQ